MHKNWEESNRNPLWEELFLQETEDAVSGMKLQENAISGLVTDVCVHKMIIINPAKSRVCCYSSP